MGKQEELEQKEIDKSLIGDFLKEVLSLDHGIPGTFWMMLKNPKVVIDGYFTEKPAYVNPFRYSILLIALTTLISTFFIDYELIMEEASKLATINSAEEVEANFEEFKTQTGFDMALYLEAMKDVSIAISTKFSQVFYILVMAPLFAFSSRLFFKKKKSSFKHHYVMALYALATLSLFSLFILPVLAVQYNIMLHTLLSGLLMMFILMYTQFKYLNISGFKGVLMSFLSFILGYFSYFLGTLVIQIVGGFVLFIIRG